jgi:hypothetical protein
MAALPSREGALDTHWVGAWVYPRVSQDMVVRRKVPSLYWDSKQEKKAYITEMSVFGCFRGYSAL